MNIARVFDRTAFNNAVCKLVLDIHAIENIINDFSAKVFETWEDRECEYCKEDRRCKKHRALDRVLTTEKAVKVNGIKLADNLDGVYISKSDIFIFNHEVGSCLIIDCPPLFTKGEGPVNDTWIRRIIPFTFGRFEKTIEMNIEQEIEIEKIFEYRTLTCPLGRLDHSRNNKFLVLHNNYGMYHWEIES